MSSSDQATPHYEVVCVCGGYGFPLGTASAARITMIGKTLRGAGVGFRVLHCGPSPVALNNQKAGVHEGIPFEYTTPVRRPNNKLVRVACYAWGLAGVTVRVARLWPKRHSTVVYLYVQDGQMNVWLAGFCKLLQFSILQEFCEWPPANPDCSALDGWLYRKHIFKTATAALVISKAIEGRVRDHSAGVNQRLIIHRLPVIVDAQRFASASSISHPARGVVPHFVWCGTWFKDALFLIRALAYVKSKGHACRLTIIGESGEGTAAQIRAYAAAEGLSDEDLLLTGCVDHATLAAWNKSAAALLMPLWKDDQSVTRLPNKMGEYLASGRPIITSKIGDLTDYLTDGVNAYVGEPDDERDFAERMIQVLENPERATQIGASGQQTCLAQLDYRAHLPGLGNLIAKCIEERRTARLTPRALWKQSRMFFRRAQGG